MADQTNEAKKQPWLSVDGWAVVIALLLAALVLLAACANLGGLFAAHVSDRAEVLLCRALIP